MTLLAVLPQEGIVHLLAKPQTYIIIGCVYGSTRIPLAHWETDRADFKITDFFSLNSGVIFFST